jgi:DNA-binding HxlR family transcriptional regulator
MGRGLSELQRSILRLAFQGDDSCVYGHEILKAHYGWYQSNGWADKRRGGAKRFSREFIGITEWNAHRAAVARALRRLEDRGLVTRICGAYSNWSGAELTEQGKQVASALNGYDVGNVANQLTDSEPSQEELTVNIVLPVTTS